MKSIVYVVMDPQGKSLEHARTFGRILVMLNGREGYNEALQKLRNNLIHFRSSDFLLLIGNPTLISMASRVLSEYGIDRVQHLRWIRESYEYVCEIIDYEQHQPIDAAAYQR